MEQSLTKVRRLSYQFSQSAVRQKPAVSNLKTKAKRIFEEKRIADAKIISMNNRLQSANAHLQQLVQAVGGFVTHHATLREKYRSTLERADEMEKRMRNLDEKEREFRSTVQTLLEEIKLVKKWRKRAEDSNADNLERLAQFTAKANSFKQMAALEETVCQSLIERINGLRQSLVELTTQRTQLAASVQADRDAMSAEWLLTDLISSDALRTKLQQNEASEKELRQEITALQSSITDNQNECLQVQQEVDALQKEISGLHQAHEQQIVELDAWIDTTKAKSGLIGEEIAATEEQTTARNKKVTAMTQTLQETKKSVSETDAAIDVTAATVQKLQSETASHNAAVKQNQSTLRSIQAKHSKWRKVQQKAEQDLQHQHVKTLEERKAELLAIEASDERMFTAQLLQEEVSAVRLRGGELDQHQKHLDGELTRLQAMDKELTIALAAHSSPQADTGKRSVTRSGRKSQSKADPARELDVVRAAIHKLRSAAKKKATPSADLQQQLEDLHLSLTETRERESGLDKELELSRSELEKSREALEKKRDELNATVEGQQTAASAVEVARDAMKALLQSEDAVAVQRALDVNLETSTARQIEAILSVKEKESGKVYSDAVAQNDSELSAAKKMINEKYTSKMALVEQHFSKKEAEMTQQLAAAKEAMERREIERNAAELEMMRAAERQLSSPSSEEEIGTTSGFMRFGSASRQRRGQRGSAKTAVGSKSKESDKIASLLSTASFNIFEDEPKPKAVQVRGHRKHPRPKETTPVKQPRMKKKRASVEVPSDSGGSDSDNSMIRVRQQKRVTASKPTFKKPVGTPSKRLTKRTPLSGKSTILKKRGAIRKSRTPSKGSSTPRSSQEDNREWAADMFS